MKRACPTCGRPNCGTHQRRPTDPTSWNGRRSKSAQHRFALAVKDRDDWTCQDCGARNDLQAHHLIPGLDDPAYGVCLCRPCHRARDPQAR